MQPQNNERAITAIKRYDQSVQSSDAEFHWSLLVKSYHPSDTSIYHWALTLHAAVVIIKMTGVALFSTILTDNSCMKVKCQKVFIYLGYLDGFYFLCFSTRLYQFWLCSCRIFWFLHQNAEQRVRGIQGEVWSIRQSNVLTINKWTNNQMVLKLWYISNDWFWCIFCAPFNS